MNAKYGTWVNMYADEVPCINPAKWDLHRNNIRNNPMYKEMHSKYEMFLLDLNIGDLVVVWPLQKGGLCSVYVVAGHTKHGGLALSKGASNMRCRYHDPMIYKVSKYTKRYGGINDTVRI